MEKYIANIWTNGTCLSLFVVILMGHVIHSTVRKLNWLAGFLFPPLFSWIGLLPFSWSLWSAIAGAFIVPVICTFLSYKLNRGGKDIRQDECNGITGATWKQRKIQQKQWNILSEEQKAEWRRNYAKNVPSQTPVIILFLINLIPYLLAMALLFVSDGL